MFRLSGANAGDFNIMTALKKVKIGNKVYFIDARLNELRNVKNFMDSEKMEGSEETYLNLFGEYTK